MADIFLSYSSGDRSSARRLADALQTRGWTVWWDRRLRAGADYADVIAAELKASRCIIVLWSMESMKSGWVRDEANEGLKRRALIPVMIEKGDPPIGFRSIQTADLTGWDGDASAPGFQELVSDLVQLLGDASGGTSPQQSKPESPNQESGEGQKHDGGGFAFRKSWVAVGVLGALIVGPALFWYENSIGPARQEGPATPAAVHEPSPAAEPAKAVASASAAGSSTMPDSTRQRILKSFEDFASFFHEIGAENTPKVGLGFADPGFSTVAYYDPSNSTVFIDPTFINDANVPLREYAHAVLLDTNHLSFIGSATYNGIESGLASYFASSFIGNPLVPSGGNFSETLDNSRRLDNLPKDPVQAMNDGIFTWGGAFWELRHILGNEKANKILFQAWRNTSADEIKKNDPRDFIKNLLAANQALYGSQDEEKIRDLFKRRGLFL